MSQPLWDNPDFNKLERKQNKLFGQTHKFVVEKDKSKIPSGATPGEYGHWEERTDKRKLLEEYRAVTKQLKDEFGY